jgi:hypothetical protein
MRENREEKLQIPPLRFAPVGMTKLRGGYLEPGLLFGSEDPPCPSDPSDANGSVALYFVIPTGAKRSGGICSFS